MSRAHRSPLYCTNKRTHADTAGCSSDRFADNLKTNGTPPFDGAAAQYHGLGGASHDTRYGRGLAPKQVRKFLTTHATAEVHNFIY